jgi:NAD(P)-dependent dehydrogenase (short-subunit alcohol dehydrogenase family)
LLALPRMTRTQQTAVAAGAAAIGAALVARGMRASRACAFTGQSVLITGARGLGLEIARQIGKAGARVTLAARDEGELERARQDLRDRGIDADAIACDVRNRDDARRLVREVVARTGRIDVLINNAGVIQVGPLEHMQRGDFEEAMAVHFWGPLHTMLEAIPEMKRHGAGRIVNIASIGGKIGVPHLTPYCASKFALTGLSESVRAELAKDHIYVTTVCPGLMRTCRHGDAQLVITLPAKLAVIANAVVPEAVATIMALANRLVLPAPTQDDSGDRRRSGWQSMSPGAPSRLTTLTERAAAENNQLPQ